MQVHFQIQMVTQSVQKFSHDLSYLISEVKSINPTTEVDQAYAEDLKTIHFVIIDHFNRFISKGKNFCDHFSVSPGLNTSIIKSTVQQPNYDSYMNGVKIDSQTKVLQNQQVQQQQMKSYQQPIQLKQPTYKQSQSKNVLNESHVNSIRQEEYDSLETPQQNNKISFKKQTQLQNTSNNSKSRNQSQDIAEVQLLSQTNISKIPQIQIYTPVKSITPVKVEKSNSRQRIFSKPSQEQQLNRSYVKQKASLIKFKEFENHQGDYLQLKTSWKSNTKVRCILPIDNKLVAGFQDGSLIFYDSNGQVLQSISQAHHKSVNAIAFYNKVLVTASSDTTLNIMWEQVDQGYYIKYKIQAHQDVVKCICLYNDWVLSGSYDTTFKIHNVSNKDQILSTSFIQGRITNIIKIANVAYIAQDKLLVSFDLINKRTITQNQIHSNLIVTLTTATYKNTTVISSSSKDGTFSLIKSDTLQIIASIKDSYFVKSILYYAVKDWIILGLKGPEKQGKIVLIKLSTLTKFHEVYGSESGIECLAQIGANIYCCLNNKSTELYEIN